MTKLVNVRVCVAVDDAVTTENLKNFVKHHLSSLPLTDDEEARVHWSSVSVTTYSDRPPNPRPPTSRKRPTTPQPELPQ